MELHLTKKDFKIEWFSGTGAGGQYRNKHQNCCRITHIETNIQAISTDRERTSNFRKAFKTVCKRVVAHYQRVEAEKNNKKTSTEVIRNYNESRNEVHDKISGLKMPYKVVVLNNNIQPMIEARSATMTAKKLSNIR